MKCQRKASPYSACFASRSCARFSPRLDAGLGERGHVRERDVLRGGDDRHAGPDLRLDALEARPDLVRR